MSPPARTILLVEDSEDDVFTMMRALKLTGTGNPVQVVTDGQQALDYLSGHAAYRDRERFPLPFIVFLDLKLPYMKGFEVLWWMRQRPELKGIVVVVLTGSCESKDQERAYALGARSYLVKPPTRQTLIDIFDSLRPYWHSRAEANPLAPAAAGN